MKKGRECEREVWRKGSVGDGVENGEIWMLRRREFKSNVKVKAETFEKERKYNR